MKFRVLEDSLGELKSNPNPSELHGLITGWMCSGSRWAKSHHSEVLKDWLEGEMLSASQDELISNIADDILDSLGDTELGFQLLLPDDETSINTRQQSISQWCAGFLSGFGMSGRFKETELNEEVAEVFGDLARIAGLDEEIPESDENEADLMEIGEYVRMSAILVFTECANRAVH